MPLSDQEIEALLKKAKSYEDSAAGADALEQALSCYNKIIENIPNHPYYYEQRSGVKYRLSGLVDADDMSYIESAIDDISKAIELDPDEGAYYGSRGFCYFEKLSHQAAIDERLSKRIAEDYRTCIKKNPTEPLVWLHLLSLNLILQNYDEAISIYGQCKPYISDKEHQLIRAWFGCIVFILAGDLVEEEDLEPLYNQESRLNGVTLINLTGLVTLINLTMTFLKRLLEKEKNEERHKKVNELNELLFSHIDDWSIRGDLLKGFGCFDEANRAYEKAIEFNPNNALAHNNLGTDYYSKGMYDEAILAYKKAVAINPNCANAHYNLGTAYDGKGMYDAGILAYKKAIAINPNHADAHLNLGTDYHSKGMYDEAIHAYKKAIAINPNHAGAHNNLGIAYRNKREGTKQDGGAGKSMKQKPSSLKDWILGKLNRHEEAPKTKTSLSKQEIEELIQAAESYMKSGEETQGDALLHFEQVKQALKCYDQIIENSHPHPSYFNARATIKYIIAIGLARYDDIDEAIDDINKAIELDPDRGDYYQERGQFLKEKGYKSKGISDIEKRQLLERAVADYKKCKEKDPTNSQVWLGLIEMNIIAHNWDDAISTYGQCKEYMKDQKEKFVRSWLGCLALALAGDPIEEEDKKPLYDQTIRDMPNIHRVVTIGLFLNKIYEDKSLKEKWKKANEIHERFMNHFDEVVKGTIFYQLNRHEEALEAYEKAIELKPDYAEAWTTKGTIFHQLNRHEEALEAYEKAIELKPGYAEAWCGKGNAFCNLNRHEEAIAAYEKAIELKPDYAEAWCGKGNAFYNLNRHEEAIEAIDKAIELKSDFTEAWYSRGLCFDHLKRYDKALRAYEKVIELRPDFADAWHGRGTAFDNLNRHEEALEAYEKTIELNSDHANAWYLKGWRLDQLKRYEEALKAYEKVTELKPDFADAWDRVGYCLLELRRYEEALEAINKAIELDPNLALAKRNKVRILGKLTSSLARPNRDNVLLRLKQPNSHMDSSRSIENAIQDICRSEFGLESKVVSVGNTVWIYAPFKRFITNVQWDEKVLEARMRIFHTLGRVFSNIDNPPKFYCLLASNIEGIGFDTYTIGSIHDLKKFNMGVVPWEDWDKRVAFLSFPNSQALGDIDGEHMHAYDIQPDEFARYLSEPELKNKK